MIKEYRIQKEFREIIEDRRDQFKIIYSIPEEYSVLL